MEFDKIMAKVDLVIQQGADLYIEMVWRDQFGDLVDLTAYTARMQIRPVKGSLDALASSMGNNPTITLTLGGLTGVIEVDMTASDTTGLSFTRAVYDLEMIDVDGKVTRILEGNVKLSKEVTKLQETPSYVASLGASGAVSISLSLERGYTGSLTFTGYMITVGMSTKRVGVLTSAGALTTAVT